jgi:hypothetical protein
MKGPDSKAEKAFSYINSIPYAVFSICSNNGELTMPNDKFQNSSDSLISPAQVCFNVTPDDLQELEGVTKAIYVGQGGDVTLRPVDNLVDVTFRNVANGAILDIRVSAIRATGTTATDIVGLA